MPLLSDLMSETGLRIHGDDADAFGFYYFKLKVEHHMF